MDGVAGVGVVTATGVVALPPHAAVAAARLSNPDTVTQAGKRANEIMFRF